MYKKLFTAILVLCLTSAAIAQEQCKATTKAGTQCKRKAVEVGYCKHHNPNAKRCAGTTKAGKPCQMIPKDGETYCFHHKK